MTASPVIGHCRVGRTGAVPATTPATQGRPYVEFTLTRDTNALTVRYSIPDRPPRVPPLPPSPW
jgi:hypothetical protein